ncbi:hypothetical protein BTJ45_05729 [Bacillus mycoides]|nr:hypothetical protein BTJ45_05729 [Bacillus mycoides]
MLGEDKGGRLFEITKKDDLEKVQKYYDELGNSSPLFFSHTYEKGNVLLQMNGDMNDEEFAKYKDVLDKFIKSRIPLFKGGFFYFLLLNFFV